MNRARKQPGDTLILCDADIPAPGIGVIVARSRGWAEVFDVRYKLDDGSYAAGIIALQPSGSWCWIRHLEPVIDVDETGG